jgi:hypothetical protein
MLSLGVRAGEPRFGCAAERGGGGSLRRECEGSAATQGDPGRPLGFGRAGQRPLVNQLTSGHWPQWERGPGSRFSLSIILVVVKEKERTRW